MGQALSGQASSCPTHGSTPCLDAKEAELEARRACAASDGVGEIGEVSGFSPAVLRVRAPFLNHRRCCRNGRWWCSRTADGESLTSPTRLTRPRGSALLKPNHWALRLEIASAPRPSRRTFRSATTPTTLGTRPYRAAAIALQCDLGHSARAAVTNGRRLHGDGVDGRSREARRFRDLVTSFADSLGGEKALSEADRSLVRTAAALAVQNERLQADAVAGRKVSSEDMTRLANASKSSRL